MKEQDRNIVHQLVRDHEDLAGSSRAALLSIDAFIASIKQLRCLPAQIPDQYKALARAIKSTRPRIIPLIHLIEEFEQEIEPYLGGDAAELTRQAIEILQTKHDKLKNNVGKVIELGLGCIDDGDVIVVHTASLDVTRMLAVASEVMEKKIKVVILKQDILKTKRLINTLKQARVELEIIPEYALSHFIACANKMFFGAISVTADMQVVTAVGTASIASLCHFHNIPVYLFANTLKFSHKGAEEQQIHQKHVAQTEDSCEFVLTTYSHDLVDLKMVDFLVTDQGRFAREQIEAYVSSLTRGDAPPARGSET